MYIKHSEQCKIVLCDIKYENIHYNVVSGQFTFNRDHINSSFWWHLLFFCLHLLFFKLRNVFLFVFIAAAISICVVVCIWYMEKWKKKKNMREICTKSKLSFASWFSYFQLNPKISKLRASSFNSFFLCDSFTEILSDKHRYIISISQAFFFFLYSL